MGAYIDSAKTVRNFYQNVLHNANRATRSENDRDDTEDEFELIRAAKQARAHKSEKDEETGKDKTEEEKKETLEPYEAENLLRSAMQAEKTLREAARQDRLSPQNRDILDLVSKSEEVAPRDLTARERPADPDLDRDAQ